MVNELLKWLDHRTGYKQMMHEALYENVPSGARWRYVTGSMLVFAFVVQAITGVFLWMGYSPSSQTAWESVYYIQHEMQGGWLVRGVHHFMAQAMVVVLALHLLQVVIDGAYRSPREVNYWLGLILMKIVLGLGLTGYLLPWDQKGYWATNVATNLMTLVPFAGAELQKVVVGGNEYGHATLTRFFALHAGVLPGLLVAFLGLHIMVFRRHGLTAHITPGRKDQDFWPHQVLLDAVACLVMLGVVVLCVINFDVGGLLTGNLGDTGRLGAELGAPADPSEQYSAARPEWYYLFLFQLLKFFEGSTEWIGAIVLPGALMGLLFLMPIIGRSQRGHKFNIVAVLVLVGGAGVLTAWAMVDDNFDKFAAKMGLDPAKYEKQISSAKDFHQAKEKAEVDAHRMIELVNRRQTVDGKPSQPLLIPKQGAVYLLRNDPLTQGPRLFAKHCASCHEYVDPTGKSDVRLTMIQDPKLKDDAAKPEVARSADGQVQYDEPGATAPNLFGFASRDWIKGLLDKDQISAVSFEPVPATDERVKDQADHPANHRRRVLSPYFGNTAHKNGRMAEWVKQHVGGIPEADREAIVVALSAQARLRTQSEADAKDADKIRAGVKLIEHNCARGCHRFGDTGPLGLAPDLTGYGSYEWMLSFLSDPTHERFYRQENDRMPSFAKDLDQPARHTVSVRELSLIVDWMRGEYYQADDPLPVLPHSEEVARRTVTAGRTTSLAVPAVIGAEAPAAPTKLAQAESLFKDNCAACHSHADGSGRGVTARRSSAPNLFRFASRDWLTGLLDPAKVAGEHYFGGTSHVEGDMVGYVNDNLKNLDDAKKTALADLVVALSAEAGLASQAEAEQQAPTKEQIERGRKAFGGTFTCADCHKFRDAQDGSGGPDLTGYGSLEWLKSFVANPGHDKFYGAGNDRMPAFGAGGTGTKKSLLTAEETELLAKWIRGDKID